MEKRASFVPSHVPALIALGRAMPVRTVLELGAGMISTPLFLDRRAFPILERLDSLESDATWWRCVAEAYGIDARLHLAPLRGAPYVQALEDRRIGPEEPVLIPGEWLAGTVKDVVDLNRYDVIFIDDGRDADERIATIEAVGRGITGNSTVVVIHDWEHEAYRFAANRAWRSWCRAIFDALEPLTAFLWATPGLVDFQQLRAANAAARTHWSETVAVTAWLARLPGEART